MSKYKFETLQLHVGQDPVHELCFLYMQQMIPGRDKEIHPKLRRCLYEDYFER